MKLFYFVLFAIALEVSYGQDCASQLAGMKDCMHKQKADHFENLKAAVQKCFDDLNCPFPEAPEKKPGRCPNGFFSECKAKLMDLFKPKLEECIRAEEPLLAGFSMPERPNFDDIDAMDRVMFMLMRHGHGGPGGRMGGHGGGRGRGGRFGGSPPPQSADPFDDCEGLKECIIQAKQANKPDFQAARPDFSAVKQQCFEELGVEEACQALDMRGLMCNCSKKVAEENADELAEALADCLEEQGEADVDVEDLKAKIAGMAGKFCHGPGGFGGRKGGRPGFGRFGGGRGKGRFGRFGKS